MRQNLPKQASRMLAVIEASVDDDIARSPRPDQAPRHRAGELRLPRAAVHVVLRDMLAQAARR